MIVSYSLGRLRYIFYRPLGSGLVYAAFQVGLLDPAQSLRAALRVRLFYRLQGGLSCLCACYCAVLKRLAYLTLA